jgi:hypothetical protein|tara:strand:- start:10641 stop:10877 length:237 start_codon:yes stop_codon:yes gene_type:complete
MINLEPKERSMSKQGSILRSFLSYGQSVLAGLVGVQSGQKHEEDINGGGLERMIYIGLGTLVVFVIIVVIAVNSALPN